MNSEKKCVYVIGHRNPDTDSVVSAAALADLRRNLGYSNYTAARAGKINPQTEYIFNRFKVPVPEYVPDLIPKVGYYMPDDCDTVNCQTSLWSAIGKMENCNSKVLPVVSDDGTYHSLLHYNAFAQNVLKILNPESESALITSIKLIQDTLNAQPLLVFDEEELFRSSVLVAAAQFETFKKRAKAEKARTSVLISPYDTASTAMFIVYATPVSVMADKTIKSVKATDLVRMIRYQLSCSPSRSLPVTDDDNKIIGIISETDLLQEANIDVALVDHNEMTQAVEGIDNYQILEIIDHHRLGNLSTRNPITFINKPVGATSTIITNMYRENHVPLTKEIASILLCGILADTLTLQSSTTTDTDRETAEYLSNITNLDIAKLGSDIALAACHVSGRSASDVIHQDMKEYTENDYKFSVSQIEVDNTNEIIGRKQEIERRTMKALFCSLMVTDITRLTSVMLVACDPAFLSVLSFPKLEDSVYVLKDIVSRKKQLIPLLTEQITKLGGK